MDAGRSRARKIHDLLVTGDNRLKQGVSRGEDPRELRAGAGSSRRSTGSRTPCGRSSRSGSPISNGSQEDLLHPSRLQPESCAPPRPRAPRRSATAASAAVSSARASSPTSSGSTSTPASGGTNSGGPPIRVATTLRPHAIASSSAWPNGSISAGPQTTSAALSQRGHVVVRDAADDANAGRALRACARSGPSPTNVSEPRPSRANASASRTTFLRSVSEPTCTNAGCSSCGRRRDRGEPLEVDAGVDAPPSCRAPRAAAPRARAAGSPRRRSRSPRARTTLRVRRATPGTAPMLRTSRPCAVTTSGASTSRREEPGRHEEVRPDDVRRRAPRARVGAARGTAPCRRRADRAPRASTSCPRSRSARSCCATNEPRSGSSGPGYICETTRIFTPRDRRAAARRGRACGRRSGRSRAGRGRRPG